MTDHDHLIEACIKKFSKALIQDQSENTPVWKNIFLLLDLIGQRDFFGRIELTINGTSVKDVVIVRRTFKVNDIYLDIEGGNPKESSEIPQVLKSKDITQPGSELS